MAQRRSIVVSSGKPFQLRFQSVYHNLPDDKATGAAALPELEDYGEILMGAELRDRLEGSMRWELRLPHVTQDAYRWGPHTLSPHGGAYA